MNRRSLFKIGLIAFPAFVLAGCVETGPTADPTAFAAIAGSYTGQIDPDDGAPRPLAIIVRPDGSYTWSGAYDTDGQLTLTGGDIRYANEIGSRGVVSATGNTLTWRNRFTGDSYTVTVTR